MEDAGDLFFLTVIAFVFSRKTTFRGSHAACLHRGCFQAGVRNGVPGAAAATSSVPPRRLGRAGAGLSPRWADAGLGWQREPPAPARLVPGLCSQRWPRAGGVAGGQRHVPWAGEVAAWREALWETWIATEHMGRENPPKPRCASGGSGSTLRGPLKEAGRRQKTSETFRCQQIVLGCGDANRSLYKPTAETVILSLLFPAVAVGYGMLMFGPEKHWFFLQLWQLCLPWMGKMVALHNALPPVTGLV